MDLEILIGVAGLCGRNEGPAVRWGARVQAFGHQESGPPGRDHGRRAKRSRAAAAPTVPASVSSRFLEPARADPDRRPGSVSSGASLRAIAAWLRRAVSTITREPHRNRQPDGNNAQPHAAHQLATDLEPRRSFTMGQQLLESAADHPLPAL
ncbi:helix-turn-helix domain-containing protein [Amycolatopsis sp. FDAARGOS 1241]|uniref:helix-turn-helix domain-containing protein n=1 Tax=Amycolatopsis sp. FDAARGOS 1241 TaxID=2778070 RepID=UPI001950F428|nr:helix-turn-helix domain-containing protein [Amycolatopsis sp. FDAARGOS 1241]QRP44942.1 helix-turn-helix domain-containing protein [Amycolatopsis sp. FDAARGOS 1241]